MAVIGVCNRVEEDFEDYSDGEAIAWDNANAQFLADDGTPDFEGSIHGELRTGTYTVWDNSGPGTNTNAVAVALYVGNAFSSTAKWENTSGETILKLSYENNSGHGEVRVNGITAATYDNASGGYVTAEMRNIDDWSSETGDLHYNESLLQSGASFVDTGAGSTGATRIRAEHDDASFFGAVDAFCYRDVPDAVDNLSVEATREGEVDLEWSGVSGADDYNVYSATSPGVTTSDTLESSSGSSSRTVTGLEDGKTYHFIVTAENELGESDPSNEVSTTTPLPAPTIALDTATENEITVTYSAQDNSNEGSIDIYRSTDGSLGTVVHTDAYPFAGEWTDDTVADGETYHYTARRIGDDASADSAQLAGTTPLPAPTGLTIVNTFETGVELSWTDNADNEDGYRVYTSTDGGQSWSELADLAPDTTTYTTSGQESGETYTYKIRVYTEESISDSGTVSETLLVAPDVLPGSENAWIALSRGPGDHRQLDETISEFNPVREHTAVSDWEATVAYDTSLEGWLGATVWLYDDDELLFKGELLDVDSNTGRAETVLAGDDVLVELDRTDTEVTYQNILGWNAVDDFIDTDTVFESDVTEPSATETSEVLGDYTDGPKLAANAQLTPTDPVLIDDDGDGQYDGMEFAQTGWILEAEDGEWTLSGSGAGIVTGPDKYSGDQAISSGTNPSSGDYWEVEFTTAYEIDPNDLQIEINHQFPDSNSPGFEVLFNGVQIIDRAAGIFTTGETVPDYHTVGIDPGPAGDIGTLQPGTHTIRVRFTDVSLSNDSMLLDCIGVADMRFNHTFDNSVTDGVIQSPERYPEELRVEFPVELGTANITSALIETVWNDPTRAHLGVSFDRGASKSYHTGDEDWTFQNTTQPTTSAMLILTLKRYDSGDSSSPALGDRSTKVFSATVTGQGDTMGVIEGPETFTGSQLEVLQTLLDRAGMRMTPEYAKAGWGTIAAFRTGDVVESADWVVAEGGESRSVSMRGYYNRVVVRGKKDENGDRPEASRQDDAEIAALASRLGITTEQATHTKSIKKPDIEKIEDLKSIARSTLDALLQEDSLTGSLEVAPVMIDPGKSYAISAWGAYGVGYGSGYGGASIRSLERVTYTLGVGGLSGTLEFKRPEGLGVEIDAVAGRERETRDAI